MPRIAAIVPQQGPTGMYGPSCVVAARLAVQELNSARGIQGEKVELVTIDGGASPEEVARSLQREMHGDGVHAVTGWHISSVRRAISPLMGNTIPYLYPALYEGGNQREEDGVFFSGEVPENQIDPALKWFEANLGLQRWFIVGSDYIWPRQTAGHVVEYLRRSGLVHAGSGFIPLSADHEEMGRLLDAVIRSEAEGVLILFPGQDGVEFHRRFVARGLDEQMIRFTPLLDENMLMALGEGATASLFTSAGYFRSSVTDSALDFQGRYTQTFGPSAPPLNSMAESTYSGIRMLAALAERAGSLSVPAFSERIDGQVLEVPRGELSFNGSRATQRVYLAVADGYDFAIVDTL